MGNGRYCDNCETYLNEKDYADYGSWSYTCPDCGFVYRHGHSVSKQLAEFNKKPMAVDGGHSKRLPKSVK